MTNRVLPALLGIFAAATVATGCTAQTRPLTLAFAAPQYTLDDTGLSQLLKAGATMSLDERRSQLKAYVDAATKPELKQKSSYALARVLQRLGGGNELKEAIGLYQQASALTPLWERCQWHIVECATIIKDEQMVRSVLTALSNKASVGDSKVEAQYALGQSYMRTAEHSEARETFSKIINNAPKSQFALGSTYYLAEIDLHDAKAEPKDGVVVDTAGLQARALTAFRHYLKESPDGRFATEIVSQLRNMDGFTPTPADHNLFAQAYFSTKNYKEALSEWQKSGSTADWFKRGTALLRLNRTAEAKATLDAGIKNHPSDPSIVAATTLLSRLLNKDGAYALWKGVLQRSPQAADAAMYNLAIRSPAGANVGFYRQILNTHPTSAFAPESAWWLAWNDIQGGRSASALSTLESAATRYAHAKAAPRYLFWIGKLHERLGDKSAAKAAYARAASNAPWHYYAHRATARINALNGGRDPGWSTNPKRSPNWVNSDNVADWDFPEPPAELAREAGATVELLTELRQWDEALELISDKHGVLKAFYLAKLDLPLEAINAAGTALHGKPHHNEPWQIAYPVLYAKYIAKEAKAKNVDPLLAQALIREESRYHVHAVSVSHALGLMQLMPATALGVAKRLGVPINSNADIHKPENNLRLGIDYLSYVLGRFKGNALYAVASYNGGPNAVQRWAARAPGDTDVFVENIPFTETRDYVRKVFGSYWNYQSVYASSSAVNPTHRVKHPL